MRKRIAWLFLVVIALSGPVWAADGPVVTGVWSKVYFTEGGRKDFDSRWSLEMSFSDEGTFLWTSVSLQEEWLVEAATGKRTTKVIRTSMELKGTYSISGETITFRLSPVPDGEAATWASLNLGYDAGKKQGSVTFKIERDNLILAVPSGTKRHFAFTRAENPSNKTPETIGAEAAPQPQRNVRGRKFPNDQ